tara:strand:+ start:3620 stop:4468 length:849 start_codon:yes stop_codon:yes gene_type:complete
MFHVENDKIYIETKDYLFSNEKFQLTKTHLKGLLKTTPQPSKENIKNYYNTKEYISHNSEKKGGISFLYKLFRKFNFYYKASFVKRIEEYKYILDFGSGEGHFLKNLSVKGYSVFGVEPIKSTQDNRVFFSIFDNKLKKKKFNIITAWHSLEHVYDFNKTIKTFHDLLNENGEVVVAVPNYSSFDSLYYKKHWAGFDVPRHLWHFDKSSLIKSFTHHGFSFISSHPLLLDAYYVSLLSENYRKSNLRILRAFVIGTISNLMALFTKNFSSNVFVFKKTNTNT